MNEMPSAGGTSPMPRQGAGSVSLWIDWLKSPGDGRNMDEASRRLWERYFERLVALARRRLGGVGGKADGEDVALSAIETFFRRAGEGRFPRLDDRDGLWRLLMTITTRKAFNAMRAETRRPALDEQALAGGRHDAPGSPLDLTLGGEPGPAEAAEFSDLLRRLMSSLGRDDEREVARLKLQGHTNNDIGKLTGMSLRSVERKLTIVRAVWKEGFLEDVPGHDLTEEFR